MQLSKFVLILSLQILVAICSANPISETEDSDLSVLAVDLGGAGISGTITEKLLQNKVEKSKISSSVVEYKFLVDLPNKEGQWFRLAVTAGLVHGKTEEEDSTTLNSLREYLESPKGLNGSESETEEPNARIENFRNFISQLGDFAAPIKITIGEIRPADYNLPVQGQSVVLPNDQLCPQIEEISQTLQSQHAFSYTFTFLILIAVVICCIILVLSFI